MKPRRKVQHALWALAAFTLCIGDPRLTAPAEPTQASTEGDASCRYDKSKLLALGYQNFDQTPGQGWRELAAGDKCLAQAADLIRDWRAANNFPHPMLYWHEGQLRALNGSVSDAVSLMELSRPQEAGIAGWNLYVDATIAFLRKDRAAFDKARTAMAAMPDAPYSRLVDQLGECFIKTYAQSYRKCEK